MKNLNLRNSIAELNEQAIVFDNPDFDNSILGIDTNGHIVYSLDLMIKELSEDDNISYDDAREFIDYNTIRMLPYIPEEGRPIIINLIED